MNSATLPKLPDVFGPIRQVAYIVPDIDQAMRSWQKQLGAGPFVVARQAKPLANAFYRGKPCEEVVLNIAFAYMGDIQLELIELVNDVPSMYKEAIERGAYSLHHYGVCVDDFPKAYNYALDNGFTAVVDAGFDGLARMSYVESEEIPGLILEVIQWNDLTRPYFEGIEQRVRSADPAQLVHEFKLSELTPVGQMLKLAGKFVWLKLTGQVTTTRRQVA